MLRITSDVPPSIVFALLRRHFPFWQANLLQAVVFVSFLWELGYRGWGWRDRAALLLAAGRWGASGFACGERTTVAELTRGLTPRVLTDLIDPLCVAALNTPAERASGRVFLRVLRDALFSGPGSADLLLPRPHADTLRGLFKQMDDSVSGFVRGQAVVILILGTFYSLGLALVGLPFGIVIGVAAALLSFIPYVGTLVGGVISIGVALAAPLLAIAIAEEEL